MAPFARGFAMPAFDRFRSQCRLLRVATLFVFACLSLLLGVVGAALVLLARVVDQARAMQAELDEIV
jgi:hypothetical protein